MNSEMSEHVERVAAPLREGLARAVAERDQAIRERDNALADRDAHRHLSEKNEERLGGAIRERDEADEALADLHAFAVHYIGQRDKLAEALERIASVQCEVDGEMVPTTEAEWATAALSEVEKEQGCNP